MSLEKIADTLERVVDIFSELDTKGLKLVKQAHIERNGDFIKIVHYDTIIFSYSLKNDLATARKNLSRTSDKQIRYAIAFFNPKTVNYIDPERKWEYSR